LRYRGRLVGGFPPSPALILPSIKAPQELTAENKKKRGHVHTHTPLDIPPTTTTNKRRRHPKEIRNPIPIPLLPTTI
jgi:hypothetical protein